MTTGSSATNDHYHVLDIRMNRLKERIYIAFSALAIVLAMDEYADPDPMQEMRILAVTCLGLVLAVFTADVISHILFHERMMSAEEIRDALSATLGGLWALIVPFLLLFASARTGWSPHSALNWSATWLIAWLVFVGYTAARKAALSTTQRIVVMGAEALLAVAVIVVKLLAY